MNRRLLCRRPALLCWPLALALAAGPVFAQAPASPNGGEAAIQAPSEGAQPEAPSEPVAGGVAPPTAQAVEEAGQRYDRGLKLYAEGDYALAVIEFERAYELVPDYRVLYNIGQVRIQLANYARARRALTEYLKVGGERVPAERGSAVEVDLEMLAARTATLLIETNVLGAEIVVDDAIVGTSPLSEPLLLDAGEHRLNVRKSGYYARSSQLTLAGRDALSTRLDLEKVPEAGSSRIIVERQAAPPPSNRAAWLWGTWSATGALAVGAAVTGGLGIKAANELEELHNKPATRSQLDSSSRRARTLLTVADVLGGLAIATGGVALYLTLSREKTEATPATKAAPKSAPAQVSVAVRPGWVGFEGVY